MVRAFIAVLIDMWRFVIGQEQVGRPEDTPTLPAPSAPAPAKPAPPARNFIEHPTGQVGYINAWQVKVLQRPVLAFDTIVDLVSYGDEVVVDNLEGSFAHISYHEQSGWVPIDTVTTIKSEIFPHFTVGEIYDATHGETIKVRQWLTDEFLGDALHLPLTGVEYVAYTISQKHPTFTWPTVRPRTAGIWQTILRGQLGVQINVEPRTGAVMEYFTADRTGVVAVVETVKPDNALLVSMIVEGTYQEQTLTEREWREMRPVFISIH